MKRRLTRLSGAFFPLAMLISAVFGDQSLTIAFLCFYFALQITSLCAPVAFCNAAAREPGVKKVGRRFWGGMTQLVIGAGVLLGGMKLILGSFMPVSGMLEITAAAFLFIIEQMFEERMFALSRRIDGGLMAMVSGGLLLIGLMMEASPALEVPLNIAHPFLLGGCAASALLGFVLTLLIAGGKGYTPLPVNYRFAPKAIVQTLFYPAAAVALAFSGKFGVELRHMLVGYALWQLSRTVCRRIRMESKPLDWILSIATAVFAVLACLHPAFMPYAVCCAAAFVCAAIVYLAPSVRIYVCLAVTLGVTALAYFHPFAYLLG